MKVFKTNYLTVFLSFLLFSCVNNNQKANSESLETDSETQPPNIVFILSDDQAWMDYGFMGHEHIDTPRLDQFASESLTFKRGYVPTSLCAPSLATIITGLYPKNHGVLGNDVVFEDSDGNGIHGKSRAEKYAPIIPKFETLNTLPDMLKDKGYLSFQTGKWWIGNFKNGGFDYGMTHGDPERGGRHGDYGLEIGRKGMDTINSYVDLALKEQKPFFLWYAPFLPHSPHNPPQRLLDKYLPLAPTEYVANYWAMCEWFDETCGELFDIIEDKGLMENTLFVYVCDNGWVQELNKGTYNKTSKRSPYDFGMRTPIMYKWKGKIEPKMDDETIVSSIDMVPTVLDILDIEKPVNLPGISVLNNEELKNREVIFGEIYAHDFETIENSMYYNIAIAKTYKLIFPDSERKKGEKIQLYNIVKDPFEQNNIADSNPEIVAELENKIKAFRAD